MIDKPETKGGITMLKFSIDRKPSAHEETGRPWYDTKEGIIKSLVSLEALCRLINLRHTAGYELEQRLNEFYILGRYSLDTCGNCAKASGTIPKEILPNIPDVLTRDEFWAYVKEQTAKDDLMLSFSMNGGNLPLPNLKCGHCKKTWYISNCHDTVVWQKTEVFSLTEFVGKTLGEVKASYDQRNNAIYRMQPDIPIRNDKYIDLSPKYPNPESDWEKSIVKNERGWIDKDWLDVRYGVSDAYYIQTGDEGFFNIWTYYHGICNRRHLHQKEQLQFMDIFKKVGFKNITLTALPNEYCPCDHCAPWFNVKTEYGIIKIGWRKRVINIDWSQVRTRTKILSLFPKEDVTKGNTYIHAWGWDKAQDYLNRIYTHMSAN